ncbi:MAG: hypothetical protein ACI8X3_001296 [Saprospiraceae bacterium]|jgi:hypothetical protein
MSIFSTFFLVTDIKRNYIWIIIIYRITYVQSVLIYHFLSIVNERDKKVYIIHIK